MSNRRLKREFFDRSAVIVAPELLGKYLVRKLKSGETLSGMITEVEAYVGEKDLGSHAAGGRRTKSTEVMYGGPGCSYKERRYYGNSPDWNSLRQGMERKTVKIYYSANLTTVRSICNIIL